MPSGRIFDTCQRFQLSDQISDISHRILPIVIRMHDPFKIVPMRSDLCSYLNKVKHVCKEPARVNSDDICKNSKHGKSVAKYA